MKSALLLSLLLTRRLAWCLVQKLQGHITYKKDDMFGIGKERNKRVSSAISTRSYVFWKSTVTMMMWQTTVNCSTRGLRRPGKRDLRSCCDESLEQPPPLTSWNADSAACRHYPRDWCCRRGTLVFLFGIIFLRRPTPFNRSSGMPCRTVQGAAIKVSQSCLPFSEQALEF